MPVPASGSQKVSGASSAPLSDIYGNLKTELIQMDGRDFLLAQTLDGSWTVSLPTADGARAERMHHPAGALTETIHIYGTAIGAVLNLLPGKIRVLSVGLGLGYVEMVTEVMFHLKGRSADLELVSLENDVFFQKQFVDWCRRADKEMGSSNEAQYPFHTFTDIDFRTQLALNAEPVSGRVRNSLKELQSAGRFEVLGDIRQMGGAGKFNLILFDLFSSKTNQELWAEPFLTQFLGERANEKCVFASYAATGNLKRALRHNGFTIAPVSGFAGKRETTLGHRQLEFDQAQVESLYRPGCYLPSEPTSELVRPSSDG